MRFAVIGSGAIVDKFIEAGKQSKGFALQAVYSRTRERAADYAARHSAVMTFTELDQLAECSEVEAVYIASPNSVHREQAIHLLHAGKHVLCEKPAASNSREWAQMQAAANERGCLVLEAMRPVHMPSFQVIRQHLPKLGTVRRLSFSYCQYSSRYDKFKQGIVENAFRPELSNGALMDIGVYPVHLMIALFGLPETVDVKAVKLHNGIDGQGSILAGYEGMLADIAYSKISNGFAYSEIQGEQGSILLNSVSTQTEIWHVEKDGTRNDISVKMHENDMVYEIEAFIRLAADPAQAALYQQYTSETLQVMDEARKQMGIVFPADEI